MKVKYIVIFLLVLVFAQGFASTIQKSRTVDETKTHLRDGYRYLTTGEWRGGIDNPPLTATLSAIPLLFVKDKSTFNETFRRLNADDYILERAPSFPRHLLIASRLIPLAFMVILGYLVFLWARDLYGTKAGIFALFLYSLSPNILAFGGIVTADMAGTLFAFAALYAFWKYINKPSWKSLFIAGIALGLAQASKLLSVFIIPALIFYALLVYFFKDFDANLFFGIKNRKSKKLADIMLSLAVVFLLMLSVINGFYLFKGTFKPLKNYDLDILRSSTFKTLHENNIVNWVPLPLPEKYVLGHDLAQFSAKDEKRAYFFFGKLGESFKSYYLLHILIKTPIALFVLLTLGFIYLRRVNLAEAYIIFYIIFILVMLSFFSKLLIGYRHILPIYPLLFLLSSRTLKNGVPKNIIVTSIIIISALWYLISSLFIFPHYLAYFNEFIGGPKNGYKYTIDSNLDWEQDLDLVKKYIQGREGEFLIDPGCKTVTGKILIPASSLQFQKWVCYQWLKQSFEPVDYIGYSWLVYDVKGTWQQTDQGYLFIKES